MGWTGTLSSGLMRKSFSGKIGPSRLRSRSPSDAETGSRALRPTSLAGSGTSGRRFPRGIPARGFRFRSLRLWPFARGKIRNDSTATGSARAVGHPSPSRFARRSRIFGSFKYRQLLLIKNELCFDRFSTRGSRDAPAPRPIGAGAGRTSGATQLPDLVLSVLVESAFFSRRAGIISSSSPRASTEWRLPSGATTKRAGMALMPQELENSLSQPLPW